MGKSSKPATSEVVWPTSGPAADILREWGKGVGAGADTYATFQNMISSHLKKKQDEWGIEPRPDATYGGGGGLGKGPNRFQQP